MKLNEAIMRARKVAKEKYAEGMLCHANPNDDKLDSCIECAKEHERLADYLEELKQYRKIGTVEELRELKNLMNPQKPNRMLFLRGMGYECPECGNELSVDEFNGEYCHWCGKKLDWTEDK